MMRVFFNVLLAVCAMSITAWPVAAADANYFPFRDAEQRLATNADPNSRIIGGNEAYWKDHPWQTAIVHAKDANTARAQFCGASVVAPGWVVTAAHCVDAGVRSDQLEVFALSDSLLSGGRRYSVERVIVHPEWVRNTGENDIALLRVRVPSGQMLGIPVPLNAERNIPVKATLIVTGWGVTEHRRNGTERLQQARVPYIHALACMKPAMHGNRVKITINKFCAGGQEQDTCSGDSGGPATAVLTGRTKLVGITSTGGDCGLQNKPGIYTKVANYVHWIDATMK